MNIMQKRIIVVFLFSLFMLQNAYSQRFRSNAYREYIKTYAGEAITQMDKYQIPASITMAQALIETGAGLSSLAKEHNNHFGIKCHKEWKGKKTYRDDDARNECFRSYSSYKDSYEDHSLFLKKKRYSKLFTYDINDYESWAKGLQKAGYATNKGYANMLIATIEQAELYSLDQGSLPSWISDISHKNDASISKRNKRKQRDRIGYISYSLLYTLAEDGDSFAKIASDMDMDAKDIAGYNDVDLNFPLKKGDVVYLQTKNKKATDKYYLHKVRVGDSMHSISQLYGIQLKYLYLLNDKDGDYVPEEGEVLRLR